MHIIQVLQPLNEDLLVSVVSPALRTCLTSGVRQGRILASTLVQFDHLVHRLVTNYVGAQAISSWAQSPVFKQQDTSTLAAWTQKLANFVKLCPAEHSLDEEIRQCNNIEAAINYWQTEQTAAMLQAILKSFPCHLCKESLRQGMPISHENTTTAQSRAIQMPRFDMRVFGSNVGHWELLLSTPALSDLLSGRHWKISAIIKEKLSELAKGHGHRAAFAGSKPVRQHLKVPLFITQCSTNLFLVWQIDVEVSYETGIPSQIIKVWDIVQAGEIDRLLEHVAVIHMTMTAQTINRCCQPSLLNAQGRNPQLYSSSTSEGVEDFRTGIKLDVRSKDQYFYNLIGKFYPFTDLFFRPWDHSSISFEFPYKLSRHETNIVCHSETSSIILGRSGTGKTTCLVYKLIGRHVAGRQFNQDNPLKQILLTRSLHLADKIRHDIRRILETLLPGSSRGAHLHGLVTRNGTEHTFLNPPETLYPYVCTFEELLQRLENTVAVVDAPITERTGSEGLEHGGQVAGGDQRNPTETRDDCVDFPKFKAEYWETLSLENPRKLPVSLVFAEIMGVIKGSNTSATSLSPLTCDQYLRQSCRIAPAFAAEPDRIALYRIFKNYERLKFERDEIDYADRVLNILRALKRNSVLKQILAAAVDEVYIDEVQDQRLVDLELILRLVKDDRCFHAAGDTAQAISQESTFRFEDLKAMIYNHFTSNLQTNKKQVGRPGIFQLGLNYRSHHGIVRMGSFVMGLLWKTFPETIDKLEPEQGLLPGPAPILFVSCESDVLAKANEDDSEHAASKLKFGAEQVVLVRDEDSKARLQSFIGDIALILTIRQSKGMEFDDVVLFDFFSSSAVPDGWRGLSDMMNSDSGIFDSRKNVAICNELKNLYVAVTRARNKLFMIETSHQKSLSPVIRLLTQCTPGSVIQLIKRDDFEFDQNLRLLRPDRLTDPKRWIERGSNLMSDGHYREALHCFEQADYVQGMKLVTAKMQQEEGNTYLARNDHVSATKAFEASIALLTEIHHIEDAVGICRRMGWLEHAAGLWVDHQEFYKAAKLFDDAKKYLPAAQCYEAVQMYSEAAEVLWKGKAFDELVCCLVHNRESLPASVLRNYVSLCKIPLKQNKLSTNHRKEIISLMGSSKEREELFLRYEIYEALEELLLEEQRLDDLFCLRLGLGNLDGALELVLQRKKAEPPLGTEDQIGQLIDYTVTGRLVENARRRKTVSNKLLNDLKRVAVQAQQVRLRQWSSAICCMENDDQSSGLKLGQIEDPVMKLVVAFQILDPDLLKTSRSFEVLLSETLHQAITIVSDVLIGDVAHTSQAILTLCGLWKTPNLYKPYVIQKWSPLAKEHLVATYDKTMLTARAWVAAKFSDSITVVHDVSKHFWRLVSPLRCAQFLNQGRCPRNQSCPWKHQYATPDICSTAVKHLLSLNSIFCGLTRLYNRQVMNEGFQVSFLSMSTSLIDVNSDSQAYRATGRSWQEPLIREVTWVSGFEQDEVTINGLLERIRCDKALSNVASSLESLLFFRLKREWTVIMFDAYVSVRLGVQVRFFRVLSQITYSEIQGQRIWQQLDLMRKLERDALETNPSAFIFRICGNDFVVPRSWLYLHVPRIYEVIGSKQIPEITHKSVYQGCFLVLIHSFCDVLRWLDGLIPLNHRFQFGQSDYSMSLLQPRNAELLAVALLNLRLSANWNEVPEVFQRAVDKVESTLYLKTVRQGHLHHAGDAASVCRQLAQAYSKYKGKNPLLIVKRGKVSDLQNVNSVQRMTMDQVLALQSHVLPTRASSPQASVSNPIIGDLDDPKNVEKIIRIQRWWRVRLSLQQSMIKTYKPGPVLRFNALMAACPGRVTRSVWRLLFVTHGFKTLAELTKIQDRYIPCHAAIMSAFEATTEASTIDQLDGALSKSNKIKTSMDIAAKTLSDAELKILIKYRDFSALRARLDATDKVIQYAKEGFEDIEAVLKGALETSTQ
ncbi:MAG: hypothetical protein Q9209_000126 [Squamulea sp. 1 TL-2023]